MVFLMMQNMKDNQKKGPIKGVGGFRPVVDWRHIAIKKRTVMDKKVILFIVTCGVVMVVIGLFLLLMGLFVFDRNCPNLFSDGPAGCIRAMDGNTTYPRAEKACRDLDADIPPIFNSEQNDKLAEIISEPSWLALRRESGKTSFVWTATGLTPNFTSWGSVPSTALSVNDECAMISSDGLWSLVSCDAEISVVCRFVVGHSVFVLVGPILIICGVIVVILSVEVCVKKWQFHQHNKGVISDFEERQKLEKEGFDNALLKTPVKVTPGSSNTTWPLKTNKTVPIVETGQVSMSYPSPAKTPRTPKLIVEHSDNVSRKGSVKREESPPTMSPGVQESPLLDHGSGEEDPLEAKGSILSLGAGEDFKSTDDDMELILSAKRTPT